MEFKSSIDYGGGIRISHLQINIGQSLLISDKNEQGDFVKLKDNKYKKLQFAVSYMF